MAVAPPQNPGLLSILAGALGGQQSQPQQPQPADDQNLQYLSGSVPAADTGTMAPGGSTQVAPVTVAAHRLSPTPPSASALDNSSELSNAQNVVGGYGQSPRSPHGTLGSLLGTLGDAFLVGSGRTPEYLPRQQQQQLAQAMVGAETDPRAAAARVAATGVPGAAEQSQKLIEQANQQDLKTQVQKQNFQYQQSRINEQTDNNIARRAPAALGFVSGVTDPAVYAQKYNLLDTQVKALDPSRSASDAYGIPTPEDWKPGMLTGAGMTTNQGQVSSDKGAARAQAGRDTDVNAASRVTAAQISAAARYATAQPSQAGLIKEIIGKAQAGTASPEEIKYLDHVSAPPKQSGIHLGAQPGGAPPVHPGSVPISMAGANNPVANGGRAVTPQQAASLPKGTHFLTSDGRWLVR